MNRMIKVRNTSKVFHSCLLLSYEVTKCTSQMLKACISDTLMSSQWFFLFTAIFDFGRKKIIAILRYEA